MTDSVNQAEAMTEVSFTRIGLPFMGPGWWCRFSHPSLSRNSLTNAVAGPLSYTLLSSTMLR